MKLPLLATALSTLALIASPSLWANNKATLTADTAASAIVWTGSKVGGEHTGSIQLKSGELLMENGLPVGGVFVMDMDTIDTTDLQGGRKAKLDGHLRSDDFFSVAAHPTATLKITDVAPSPQRGAYTFMGDLTIKGITKPIAFTADFHDHGSKARATAKIVIDRAEYDIRFKSGSFFENLGDNLIHDDFILDVDLALE